MKNERGLKQELTEKYVGQRPAIDLGRNADGLHSVLPPYVDIDGIQIHPSRVEQWKEKRKKMGL